VYAHVFKHHNDNEKGREVTARLPTCTSTSVKISLVLKNCSWYQSS